MRVAHTPRMRVGLVLLLAAALFAVVPSDSLAIRFADTPCVEAGAARVCPAGVVGNAYVVRLNGEGGCGPALPYQYRVLNGSLPPGLALDRDGLLHGIPATAGTWSFWVELSDEDPPSAAWCRPVKSEREFIMTVAAQPATVGSAYALQVSADGVGALAWSVASGTLPPGLVLSPTTGRITAHLRSPARSRSNSRRRTLAASLRPWTSRSTVYPAPPSRRQDSLPPELVGRTSHREGERQRAARDLQRSLWSSPDRRTPQHEDRCAQRQAAQVRHLPAHHRGARRLASDGEPDLCTHGAAAAPRRA